MASLNPQTLIREGQSYFLTTTASVNPPFVLTASGATLTINPLNGVASYVWNETTLGNSSTIRQDASGTTFYDETTPVFTFTAARTSTPQSLRLNLFGNPNGYITIATSSVRTLITQSTSGAYIALTTDGNINTSNIQVGTTANASLSVGPTTNTIRATAGPSRFAFGTGGIWQSGSTINIDASNSVSRHAIQISPYSGSNNVSISTTMNTQQLNTSLILAGGSLITTNGVGGTIQTIFKADGANGRLYSYDTANNVITNLTISGANASRITKDTFSTPGNMVLSATKPTASVISFNGNVTIIQTNRFWSYITLGDQLLPNSTSEADADGASIALSPVYVDPTYPNVLASGGISLISQFIPPVTGLYEFTWTFKIMSPQPDPSEYMLRWGANMVVYFTTFSLIPVNTLVGRVVPFQTFSTGGSFGQTTSPVYSYETLYWRFTYPMTANTSPQTVLRFIPGFKESPLPNVFPTSGFKTRIGAGTTLFIRLL